MNEPLSSNQELACLRCGCLRSEHNRALEYVSDYRAVMDEKCPSDEQHCICVPALRHEIERLRAELKETDERKLYSRRKLESDNERLRAALVRYGKHDELCEAVLTKQLTLPCTCGLKEALGEQPVETDAHRWPKFNPWYPGGCVYSTEECSQHRGMPWSHTITVNTVAYAPPRKVCPICHPPEQQ